MVIEILNALRKKMKKILLPVALARLKFVQPINSDGPKHSQDTYLCALPSCTLGLGQWTMSLSILLHDKQGISYMTSHLNREQQTPLLDQGGHWHPETGMKDSEPGQGGILAVSHLGCCLLRATRQQGVWSSCQTRRDDHTSIKQLIRHITATSGDSSKEDCRMTAVKTCPGKKLKSPVRQ